MSSLPIFDMIDEDSTLSRLESALRVCGLPLTLRSDSYRLEGEGAWHEAYRVTVPNHARPFIVRLRKSYAYGKPQSFRENSAAWHAEYLSTSLYYMQANRVQPGICPDMFMYHVSEDITCTIESYMGQRLILADLDATMAKRFGRQIGVMMRAMHQKKSHINGSGELAWDGANLYGVESPAQTAFAEKIEFSYNENILLALLEHNPLLDQVMLREKLDAAHRVRQVDEPVVLINRDVTPENLTVLNSNRVGIIDPYPYLGNGTRFAAWFIHCYRFLLPAYAHTQRYRHNQYDKYADVLSWIADGFSRGYIQDDVWLRQHIAAEQWLWTLEQAYHDLERLQADTLPQHKVIRHGGEKVVRQRFSRALRLLEMIEF